MAYKTIKIGNDSANPQYREFQVAIAADIAGLPTSAGAPNNCAVGSTCLCEEGWKVYILCIDNTWKEMV